MKSKALMSVAVASAFVCSAAYAGSGAKHSAWVAAGEEQYPAMIFGTAQPQGLASASFHESVGSTSSSAEGSISGSVGSEEMSVSSDESVSLIATDSLAFADDGIYSDYMIVSFTPMESWDYYLVDVAPTSRNLVALDSSMLGSPDFIVYTFTPTESLSEDFSG